MKKFIILLFIIFSAFAVVAQPKVKESEVPKEVLLGLESIYTSYKVKAWYKETGQYIADLVVDGQAGKVYLTSKGTWQYSAFPVEEKESPTLMMTYFYNSYPGYRVKKIDYIEEQNGDNYYRMMISQKGVGSSEYELVFDTRGKLLKSNAPDPEVAKKDYLTRTNPEDYDVEQKTPPTQPEPVAAEGKKGAKGNDKKGAKTNDKGKKDADLVITAEENNPDNPTEVVSKAFEKRYKANQVESGPEWIKEDTTYIARFKSSKGNILQYMLTQSGTPVSTMNFLEEDRYPNPILKYLESKYAKEKYKIEKICRIDYDPKYRDATGLKPKSYFYVVISQKIKGQKEKKITRMTFDQRFQFTGLLAEPIDRFDQVL